MENAFPSHLMQLSCSFIPFWTPGSHLKHISSAGKENQIYSPETGLLLQQIHDLLIGLALFFFFFIDYPAAKCIVLSGTGIFATLCNVSLPCLNRAFQVGRHLRRSFGPTFHGKGSLDRII